MIKTLRRRIILISMMAVTILLIAMFVTLNVLNFYSMDVYSNALIEHIAQSYNENPAVFGLPESDSDPDSSGDLNGEPSSGTQTPDSPGGEYPYPDPDGESEEGESTEEEIQENLTPIMIQLDFKTPEINTNDLLRSAYFTVTMDPSGNTVYTDVTRIANVSVQMANNYAAVMYQNERMKGWEGNYKFKALPDRNENLVYIFLDRTMDIYNQARLLRNSAVIMLICFGIAFVLVYFISRSMIRPIAQNIEQQKNFVTNAGHEIKTPLAIIQTNAEALELFDGENKWTANIKEQIGRLSVLMNNMLTLAKAEEGTDHQPKTDIDLSEMVTGFIRMFTEPAERKNVTIDDHIEPGLKIKGPRIQVGQMISILIDNAVQYCAPDSTIRIYLLSKDRLIAFVVDNICTVLPECDPERLFERFYRPDSSRYSNHTGNGIGLSAARAIVDSMGGSISCVYEENNRITFTVSLKKNQ